MSAGAAAMLEQVRTVGKVKLLAQQLPDVAAGDLRNLATDLRGRLATEDAVVALVGGTAAKPAIVVATTEGARAVGAKAGALVGVAAPHLGGKGGGKDDLAQGGGTDSSGADAALKAVESTLSAL